MLRHVALVSQSSTVSLGALTKMSAALQKQVVRDFAPLWNVRATVSAFETLDDVPTDYWPIIIMDDIQTPGAAGVHEDDHGQPFALVEATDTWSLTTSHEGLEMLADPFGRRLIAGQSPKKGQGRVDFLVEVCDPCEDASFAYQVNGVTVSDFYTPHFFDPVAAGGVRYSFRNSIPSPRQVMRGGYLSWHDPISDHWFQETFFGSKPQFRDLGAITGRRDSLRAEINRRTPEAYEKAKVRGAQRSLVAAALDTVDESTAARAKRLQSLIDTLQNGDGGKKKKK
jgi:hypothetical protein